MKWLFGTLLVLTIAVILALLAYQDPGYVILAHGTKTAELSLSLFIILGVVLFFIGYFAIRILINSWHMPASFNRWRAKQKRFRARRDSNKGLVELAQGNWPRAERFLIRHVKDSDIPLLNYLSAARAAQKQGASERRDHYLAMAHKSMAGSAFAVQLTQAELQLVHGQLEQSLATLVQLHNKMPKHTHVLFLLARIYEMLKSWQDLKKLIPELRKQQVLRPESLHELETTVYRELISIAAQHNKLDELRQSWQQTPKALRQDLTLVRHYVRCLLLLDAHNDVISVVRESMKKQWDNDLAYLYGMASAKDADKQLATAETWLKNNENNPVLLLTLGRLCMRNQLWGKARSYLDASIGIQPRSDSYRELGQLMEQLDEPENAAKYFREGLLLAEDEKRAEVCVIAPTPVPLLPAMV